MYKSVEHIYMLMGCSVQRTIISWFSDKFSDFSFTDKPENWDVWYESKFDDCDKEACLSFSKEILCARVTVDHNYYAVCQNLLSRHATWRGTSGGLLHDPPSEIAKDGRLEALLDECANPKKRYGRFQAAKELRGYLAQLSHNVRQQMLIFFTEIALAKLNHQKTAQKKHNVDEELVLIDLTLTSIKIRHCSTSKFT